MKVKEKYEMLKNGNLDMQIQDIKDFDKLSKITREIKTRAKMGFSTNEQEKIKEELEKKLEGKDKKYLEGLDENRLSKIKENMPKVANVLEVKEKLVNKIKEINEEIIRLDKLEKEELSRKDILKKAEDERQKLEKEKEELDKKWFEFDKKIRKAKNNPEEVKKIFEEQEKLKSVFEKNKNAIEKNQKVFEENKKTINNKFNKTDKEKLAKKSFETGQKISMCNEAARELMNGKDIGDIQLDKSIKGRKFDANEETKRIISSYKKHKVKQEQIHTQQTEGAHVEGKTKENLNRNLPKPKKETFFDKHPRIAAFVNKVKGLFVKKDVASDIDLEKIEQNILKSGKAIIEEEKNEKNINEKLFIPNNNEEFKNFLRKSAEKGMKEASKESLKNSDAYAKLQVNKFNSISEQDRKEKETIDRMRKNGSNIKEKSKSYSERSGDIVR